MKDIDWFSSDVPRVDNRFGYSFRFHRTFGDIPRKNFIVDGLLAKGEVSCWYGEPGATKSALATDIACHVAGGIPWMGRGSGLYDAPYTFGGEQYPESWLPADVLYLALERADQVQRRVEAFTDEHELQKPLNLAVYDGDLDFVDDEHDRLTHIVMQAEEESCKVQHPNDEDGFNIDLIVIDTLARTFGSGSDSGGEETAKVARHLKRTLSFTGAHIMLVHHTPIGDDSRLRGHGNLLAAFDQTVRVQKLKNGSLATLQKDNDTAEASKSKFAYSLKSRVVHVDERSGREITAPVVVAMDIDAVKAKLPSIKIAKPKTPKPSKSEQPVLAALAGLEAATEADWRAAYDAARDPDISDTNHRTRFSRGKVALISKGLVSVDGDKFSVTENNVTEKL